MRLFQGLPAQACVYFGAVRPRHASISGSDESSMRQFQSLSPRACVYFRVCRLKHASISDARVRARPGMRLFRGRMSRPTQASSISGSCVNSRACRPEHASISGSAGSSMRLFRSRPTQACVYFGVNSRSPTCVFRDLPGCQETPTFTHLGDTCAPGMRQFRDLLSRACVNSGSAGLSEIPCVGR